PAARPANRDRLPAPGLPEASATVSTDRRRGEAAVQPYAAPPYDCRRRSPMLISRIREKLTRHPGVTFNARERFLEIPAQKPTGFQVWAEEGQNRYTIGFEGWHEEFTDVGEALNCFAFGLSTACRLRVFRRGGMDYKWQVLHEVDGRWVVDSETGLLLFTFW